MRIVERPAARAAAAWMSLGEASRTLGIAPGTLRRWADEGRVPVFTTPGGHRRFSRVAINALLPVARARRPTLVRLGASAERMARAYRRRHTTGEIPVRPWVAGLPEETRDTFRARGRELVRLLLEHLDAPDIETATAPLREASQLAAAYGREVAALGTPLSEAVERFLWFRSAFVAELGTLSRKRGLDTREATDLVADADAVTDRLLIAMMTGHTMETGLHSDGR